MNIDDHDMESKRSVVPEFWRKHAAEFVAFKLPGTLLTITEQCSHEGSTVELRIASKNYDQCYTLRYVVPFGPTIKPQSFVEDIFQYHLHKAVCDVYSRFADLSMWDFKKWKMEGVKK